MVYHSIPLRPAFSVFTRSFSVMDVSCVPITYMSWGITPNTLSRLLPLPEHFNHVLKLWLGEASPRQKIKFVGKKSLKLVLRFNIQVNNVCISRTIINLLQHSFFFFRIIKFALRFNNPVNNFSVMSGRIQHLLLNQYF